MAAGRRETWATLREQVDDGTPVTFDPSGIWVAVQTSAPGPQNELAVVHIVETDYHPQLTTSTTLTLDSGRILWVKGIQDVDNRGVTHVLYCEEVVTP